MKTNRLGSLVLFGLLVAACGQTSSPDSQPAEQAPSASPASNAALEEALADAETGRDPARTRAALEACLAAPGLSKEDRVRADVALARLVQGSDAERAATLLEDAVSLGDEEVPKQLFALLAGHEPPSRWRYREEPTVAPVAVALSRLFPEATPEADVQIDIVVFGGAHQRTSNELGTFEIAGALRQKAVDACGLCDEVKTSIHTSRSGTSLWSSIPRYESRLERALVVIYVEEETMVPARYAKWLAAPIADVKKAIDAGDGLYAVKERPGAPPLVTIAAPRAPQLAAVEEAFARLTELPKEPVTVKVAQGLSKDEIRSGVRTRFGAFKQCYESLLERSPKAAGKVQLSFTVAGTGALTEPRVTLDPGLEDPAFRACTEKVLSSVHYGAWSKDANAKTTVRYPIELSP